jgi:hypothetical protein
MKGHRGLFIRIPEKIIGLLLIPDAEIIIKRLMQFWIVILAKRKTAQYLCG